MAKKNKYIPVFLIDTREQRPYTFTGPDDLPYPSLRTKLDEGDYSIAARSPDASPDCVTFMASLQGKVAVERKTLDDFVGSISQGRARFMREVERLKDYQFKAIVVEASLHDILIGIYTSQMRVTSVLGTIARLYLLGVPVLLAGDRYGGQEMTKRLLLKALEDKLKGN